MSKTAVVDRGAGQAPAHPFKWWLFAGLEVKGTQGPHTEEKEIEHPWWKVMCLTGVDYFSTLGYQPGIAFLAERRTTRSRGRPARSVTPIIYCLLPR